MKRLRWSRLLPAWLTLMFSLAPLLSQPAYAANTGEWKNHSTIQVGNKTYFDNKIDGNQDYFWAEDPDGCPDEIDDLSDGHAKGHLNIKTPNEVNGGKCESKEEDITLSNANRYDYFFTWVSSKIISSSDGRHTYTKGSGDLFVEDVEGCRDSIKPAGDKFSGEFIIRSNPNDYDDYPITLGVSKFNNGCSEYPAVTVRVTGTENASNAEGEVPGSTTPTGGGNLENDGATCDVGHLSWMVCPIISTVQGAINWLESLMLSLLETSPLQTNSPVHTAWASFRNIADIVFVLVFFAMIFGNALGMDNYTVKKIMPRLVAAAILVQFSYFLMQIAVDITNVLGLGIAGLFDIVGIGGTGSNNAYHIAGIVELTALSSLLVGGAVVAGIAGALLVPIGLTLIAGLISILGAFVTLQARQILIQLLVMLAPLAFVAWILPNTERFFKLWWSNLLKLLLMFPLVVLLIEAGNLVAILPAAINDSTIKQLLASIVPIIVFFMIPATFKMGGSLMTMVSGAVQKRASGYNKAIRGSQLMKDSKASMQRKALLRYDEGSGKLPKALGGNTKLGKKINESDLAGLTTRGFSRAVGGHAFSVLDEGHRKLRRGVAHAKQETLKDNMESLEPFMLGNDDLMQIAMSDKDEFENFRKKDNITGLMEDVPLTDRKGNPTKLKNDTFMKAAALRMAADAGGTLEVAKFFDQVYDRTPTQANGWRGEWRKEALGNTMQENQEIFFSAFGPNAGSLLKAAPQFNPGKGTTSFLTESAEAEANSHQTAAIPRQQQIFLGNPAEVDQYKKDQVTKLMQIISNPNLAAKVDKKDILVHKALAEAYTDVPVEEFNGVRNLTGKDIINHFLTNEGSVKNMPPRGELPDEEILTGSTDKEVQALYDYYRATGSIPDPNQLGNGIVNTTFGPPAPPPPAPGTPGPAGPPPGPAPGPVTPTTPPGPGPATPTVVTPGGVRPARTTPLVAAGRTAPSAPTPASTSTPPPTVRAAGRPLLRAAGRPAPTSTPAAGVVPSVTPVSVSPRPSAATPPSGRPILRRVSTPSAPSTPPPPAPTPSPRPQGNAAQRLVQYNRSASPEAGTVPIMTPTQPGTAEYVVPDAPPVSTAVPRSGTPTWSRTVTLPGDVTAEVPSGGITPIRGSGHQGAVLDRPQEQSPPAIGDIIMPQAQITEAASVNTPEAAPITAEQAAKGAQDALAKALEHMTPVEAPQSQSESRPSGIRTNFQVRRQAPTNAAGQAPLQYYKMNDFGRWEPISQAAYQALEAQYKGNPELMGKIQARRGNR